MHNAIIVVEAYGRKKFQSLDEVKVAWAKGGDFFMPFEKYSYISKRDYEKYSKGESIYFNNGHINGYIEVGTL